MVIERDEERKRYEGHTQHGREYGAARVGEGRVAHQARRIDHGQLVDELHGVFQRRMEAEAARADEQVAEKGNDEDGIVRVGQAGSYPPVGAVHEEKVRECVDDLGGVEGRIVILQKSGQQGLLVGGKWPACFFTPIECRCDGVPVPGLWSWPVGI